MSKSAALTKGLAAIRGFTVVSMPAIIFCSNAACTAGVSPKGLNVTLFSNPNFRSTNADKVWVEEP
jgi:hypothetical protein